MRVVTGVVFAALVLLAAPAGAEDLRVFRSGTSATGLHGVGGVRSLAVQRSGLAELRRRDEARVVAFPLGTARTATLVLRRITPFPAGARIEVMEPGGPRALALPDASYFAGRIDGDPDSHVVLVAGRTTLQGFVATGGDVFPFGPDPAGGHRSYALRDADPSTWPRPSDFCLNDLEPEAVAQAPRPLRMTPPPAVATGTLRIADVAIETDNELRAKFASDTATLDYLASLLAAATALYERDLGVRLQFSYIRLWAPETTDPWTQAGTTNSLYEVQNYWNTPQNDMQATAGQPDLVHFVSGKSVQGGVAYLDVLCNWYWAYGVSQVYGGFNLSDPTGIWDVEVFTHELGHNFGSEHTHCYDPPLDHCYGAESGCYSGPAESSQGTVMSYCHLHPGGLANITLVFGETVSARIGQSVAAAACLALDGATTTTTTSVTTTTTSSSTSTTLPGATTTTSSTLVTTTSTSSTTLVSTTSTTSTLVPTTSTSTSSSSSSSTTSTTSTTVPPTGPGACAGDDVDCRCPCPGPFAGGSWRNRGEYLRCVRATLRAGGVAKTAARDALRRAKKASCGRRQVTRCCVATSLDTSVCRIMRASACAARGLAAEDMGPGSCDPSPCD